MAMVIDSDADVPVYQQLVNILRKSTPARFPRAGHPQQAGSCPRSTRWARAWWNEPLRRCGPRAVWRLSWAADCTSGRWRSGRA